MKSRDHIECAVGSDCMGCYEFFEFMIYGNKTGTSPSPQEIDSACSEIFENLRLTKLQMFEPSRRTKANKSYLDYTFTLRRSKTGVVLFWPETTPWKLSVNKRVHEITGDEVFHFAEQLWMSLATSGASALFAGWEAMDLSELKKPAALTKDSVYEANALLLIYNHENETCKHINENFRLERK